jgi:hypothetical protein
MQLTIKPADDETHRELAKWRYPPPYDFEGAATHSYSLLLAERL